MCKRELSMIARRTLLIASAACLATATQAQALEKLPAVASFSILADLVANVGGNRLQLATLVGPDGDAHVFSPSPADARLVAAAKILFVNGLGLEGWMERLLAASASGAPVVVASSGIKPLAFEEDGKRVDDPHAWQDIGNAKIYVANIRKGLVAADPGGGPAYEANATAYLARLDALEGEVRAAIARIPAKNRRIITSHDAFGYFGTAYGMSFIAPQGVSTEAEPSARDVAKIIRQIRAEKIPAVFLENISDSRLIERIAHETGVKIGAKLFSDALSRPDGPAASYIDMMRNNIAAFTAALVG